MLALLALTLGCSDYTVNPNKEDPRPVDDTAEEYDPDTGLTEAERACRSAFDELDGAAAVDETCVAEAAGGSLGFAVEWRLTDYGNFRQYGHALVSPVVGRVTDDNGDGRITPADPPDIVFTTDDEGADGADYHGILRVISGPDGTELAAINRSELDGTQVYPYRYGGVALADVDDDGIPEILAIAETVGGGPIDSGGGGGDSDPPDSGGDSGGGGGGDEGDPPIEPAPQGSGPCRVVAWHPDGTLLWLSEAELSCAGHVPAVADLEGDGVAEVIVGATVVDGTTGATVWEGTAGAGRYAAFPQAGAISFAADLDMDGIQEVVAGNTIYQASGALACETGLSDGLPAAADLDMDGFGDVVTVGGGMIRVSSRTCALMAEWAVVGGGSGGPPTVADFDADGAPEIGVAGAQLYSVYEPDGTVLWSAPITDASSYTTGSSVYDFDGDGAAEVIYADETRLWVWDGTTGAVRIADDSHSSRTLHEYPVVADVDDDGLPEIVVPNGGGHYTDASNGLYVLGSADGSWLGGRPVWNQHAYAIVNIEDDLSVPAVPDSNWPTYNTFRSGDVNPVSGRSRPDAIPVVGVCDLACATSGELVIGVRILNGGTAPLRADLPVTLLAADGDYLGKEFTTSVVPPGGASDVLMFTVAADEIAGGVEVRADRTYGTQTVRECDEDNNDVATDAYCP
jgi:hypothetical protein